MDKRQAATTSELSLLPTPVRDDTQHPEALIPIAFVRSELFSVAKDGPRLERKPIAAERGPLGIDITYSGPHLNQDHFKAWQAAVHLARAGAGMGGDTFVVPAAELLRCMGKRYRDHDQRELLWRLLEQLQQTSVFLRTHRSRYVGALVMAVAQDERTGHVAIRLNPELSQLLTDESLDNDMLRLVSLGRDQIAMWLHNYYASWGSYRNVSVAELHRMCGTSLDVRRFRYRLRQALTKLMGGVRPFITDFRIGDDDVVYVNKKPTKVKLLKDKDRAATNWARRNLQHDAAYKAAKDRAALCM